MLLALTVTVYTTGGAVGAEVGLGGEAEGGAGRVRKVPPLPQPEKVSEVAIRVRESRREGWKLAR